MLSRIYLRNMVVINQINHLLICIFHNNLNNNMLHQVINNLNKDYYSSLKEYKVNKII
jgi:hypothetical protein